MTESHLFISAEGRHVETKVLPFTWPQTLMLGGVEADGGASVLTQSFDLSRVPAPGMTVKQTAAGLSRFVSAYDIARTTFDPSQRMQRVQPEMVFPVSVVGAGADAAAARSELFSAMAPSPFSVEDEPPIRFGLVVSGDVVHSVALVFSHLAFDLASWRPVARLLERAFAGEVVETLQSEDLVRCEASDRMQARSNAALRAWREALLALPAGGGLRPHGPGRFTQWELQSQAIAIAAQAIAAGTSVSTTSVILAGLNVVLRSTIADPPSAMLLLCSNRHHPDLSEYAGIAFQNALYVIPPVERLDDFVEYAKAVNASAARGYQNARYDTSRWLTMLAEMKAHGTAPDLSFFFNDARLARDAWKGLDKQIDELEHRGSSDRSAAVVVGRSDDYHATLFANLLDGGPTARVNLTCDDVRIPPAQAAAILHELEEFLVDRALALHQARRVGKSGLR